MICEVFSNDSNINWTAKGVERILQNVKNLMNTWRYEIAYDRTLGIDPAILDMPQDKAIARYTAEIYRLVNTNEPRANVKSVTYTGSDGEGNMNFKVVVEI